MCCTALYCTPWQALYPLNLLASGTSFTAPGPEPGLTPRLPSVAVQRVEAAAGGEGGSGSGSGSGGGEAGLLRWHLYLDTVLPAWAVMNITGEVRAWSFAPHVASSPTPVRRRGRCLQWMAGWGFAA